MVEKIRVKDNKLFNSVKMPSLHKQSETCSTFVAPPPGDQGSQFAFTDWVSEEYVNFSTLLENHAFSRAFFSPLCPWDKISDAKTASSQYHLKENQWTGSMQRIRWLTDESLQPFMGVVFQSHHYYSDTFLPLLLFIINIIITITATSKWKNLRIREIEGESGCWVISELRADYIVGILWDSPVRIYVDPLLRCQVVLVYLDLIPLGLLEH